MSFYPWLSPSVLASLDIDTIDDLFQAMQAVKSQMLIDQITVSTYPNMKKEAASKVMKRLHSQGFPFAHSEQKKAPITAEQLQMYLAGRGT